MLTRLRTIRGEDLFSQLIPNADSFVWRALLRQGLFNPETLLGRLVGAVHSPFDAFERASFQVAEGNRKIFSEMALSFARYLQMCPVDAPLDSPAVQEFLAGFRPGGPPDGQDYLRRAFTRYQTLPPRSQPGLRAQAICLANIEAGVHEQTRVQREIEAALEVAPVTAEDLTRRLLKALSLFSPKAVFLLPVARFIVVRYGKFARRVTRHVITNAMMTLETPMSAGN